ncbi:hypothetical protein JCM19241_896 [Vibrio ishigakensis]|uniref:Uncharacterized protein n=1 Tax=Vibrio ishigakensis TaxID=1481914 RepID=A0A0B8QH57_9VIBR|nr:hypothetical protein JCM19241_896 [Vibrio ishigakensis]
MLVIAITIAYVHLGILSIYVSRLWARMLMLAIAVAGMNLIIQYVILSGVPKYRRLH